MSDTLIYGSTRSAWDLFMELFCTVLHSTVLMENIVFVFKALANREINVFVRDSTVCLISFDIFLKSCDCVQLSSV